MSMFPVTMVMHLLLSEKSLIKSIASLRLSSFISSSAFASTPLSDMLPSARAFISEIFPLMTSISIFSRIFLAASVLCVLDPAPTGSKTTGLPSSFAFLPAFIIASYFCSLSVPILIFRPLHMDVISSASCGASAIIGLAPQARRTFATSFTVT